MNSFVSLLNRIFRFYYEGFTSMSWWGKRIWLILLIKLFVIFVILKLFFFPDFLKKNYRTDEQRSEHVLEQLIKPN
ncbi:MAG: DUF4492 domain-containing protein [Bacteroidales bacterium]